MSSERYEILQDDLESLLERIDASMEWVTKKTSGHNEMYNMSSLPEHSAKFQPSSLQNYQVVVVHPPPCYSKMFACWGCWLKEF